MNLQNYFGFTKSQYKGLIVLLILNFGAIAYYFIDDYFYQFRPPHDFSELIARLDSIESVNEIGKKDSLFKFNPNTIAPDQMVNLGLNASIAIRIDNYRQKGGRFRSTDDLLKIYGMDSAWFSKVRPFIEIDSQEIIPKVEKVVLKPFAFNPNSVSLSDLLKMGLNNRTANAWVNFLNKGGDFKSCADLSKVYGISDAELKALLPFCKIEPFTNENLKIEKLDLNRADSVSLLALHGVGPAFSHRILEYRNRLGGYVAIAQLQEVYGIDSLKYAQIITQLKLDTKTVKHVFVNSDEFKVLLKHPYLNYEQVKSIVNYRTSLGPLHNLSELLELEGFSTSDTNRLKPYLSFKIN